ncbi:hypothetical protein LTR36_005618 [Oleoguttula mirabilis]|uniref:Uncharacterized protein n=1 Tax=Oleoguttula mirabilis TaxID=1507867 RepID=A0AAV9JEZ7_9PEZI|nr:hypothetical protein LTR36_005618 [Oleoguttula mirabilis]
MDGSMANIAPKRQQKHRISKPKHQKLARLPPNATVSKRPLFHPAIPSPYAGASQQKVVYVTARTPFLSAVKRVEKLLNLSDKRLVQSATTLAKRKNGKRRRNAAREDEILDIATEVERQKGKRRKTGPGAVGVDADDGEDAAGEEVTLKGTGKAIARVMELALWFQQREEYTVRLRTGSVGAIDDISVDETAEVETEDKTLTGNGAEQEDSAAPKRTIDAIGGADAAVEDNDIGGGGGGTISKQRLEPGDVATEKGQIESTAGVAEKDDVPIPETRIRYTSVLEVAVSLR